MVENLIHSPTLACIFKMVALYASYYFSFAWGFMKTQQLLLSLEKKSIIMFFDVFE